MRFLTLALLTCSTLLVHGQTGDEAKRVYDASEESVFLIYLNDGTGQPNALGTGFLAAPHLIVTNAHVAEAGNPVLAVGPLRVPLKILQTDEKNDLAVLSIDVDLTSKPLPLATGNVSPGEEIFAIGNPKGLEKTISQGIVSGLRLRNGAKLIQITTPISHGSSGGPVLNKSGEVVGVAVGMLEDGQNLNFAVPVSLVEDILARKTRSYDTEIEAVGAQTLRDLVKRGSELEYSDDDSSEYQQIQRRLRSTAEELVNSPTASEDALTEVACVGTSAAGTSDLGIRAARRLVKQSPTPEHRAFLAYVLLDRSQSESLGASFAKNDSDEQRKFVAASQEFLDQAASEAAESIEVAKGRTLLLADFVLGKAKSEQSKYGESISLLMPVANASVQVCGTDLTENAIRKLVYVSEQSNQVDESEKWFRRLRGKYTVYAYDWDREGDRRWGVNDYETAADAYENAGRMSAQYFGYDYCYAAEARYFQRVTDADAVLADGRKCIDASVQKVNPSDQRYYDDSLPITYRMMAEVLNDRGVYQQALDYVRESLARKPDAPFTLNVEAKILENLQRYTECISAAQAAIRGSDGKYPWMQFTLGSCYFDTQDWTKAASSFRIAAEGDKTDASSAFNLGLSLSLQGYGADARTWFQEALKRKPPDELRAKITRMLE